ncbi:MAG: response regulator transcription factor [Cellvibrionaceae bacterium]|nr:response regulator transcription factor [Cellvibrionaceae bacterium]
MSARILLIDDDVTFGKQLITLLRRKSFEPEQCHDGEQGLLTALRRRFDLILLHLRLPTLSGFSVLEQLRQKQQTPVILLTSCGTEAERIQGYQKGADDYLAKPCNFTELLLRIDTILRRTYPEARAREKNHVITIDRLELHKSTQQARFNKQNIALTPIQFRLLWVLAKNQDQVLTKPYLYQRVLERAFSRYDRSLDMHLSRLKRKLSHVGWQGNRLTTVHGKGYCLK